MGVFHSGTLRGGTWGGSNLGFAGAVKAFTEQDGVGAYIVLENSGNFELARFTLPDPAWDSVAVQGELSLLVGAGLTGSVQTPGGGGTSVNKYRVFSAGNTLVYTADNITGIGGGGDLELSSTNLPTPGQTVRLESLTYKASV